MSVKIKDKVLIGLKKYNKITPEGIRDFIFEECTAREDVAGKLTRLFDSRGYSPVTTPGLEFMDVFSSFPAEAMYKLSDPNGRLMVLRADTTMPLARVAATRLKDYPVPLRICYKQNVYTVNQEMSGRSDEVFQAGVELIGANSKRADLEVLLLAIEGLKRCDAPDFKVEIGHAGFFKAIAEPFNLSDDVMEEIRLFIELKNYAMLNDYLVSLDNKDALILNKLPRLFGAGETFEAAKEMCKSDKSFEILDYLSEIYNDLCAVGLKEKIIVDMGLVQHNDYYSGLIFKGFVSGSGETAMSGGRYDNLLSQFGIERKATGFAINVDILAKSNALIKEKRRSPDIIVFGEKGCEAKAIEYANSLTSDGKICETALCETEEEAREYAKSRGITEVAVIGEGF